MMSFSRDFTTKSWHSMLESSHRQRRHNKTYYLGTQEFTFAHQFLIFVELDAVPETHTSGAEQTWNKLKIK